MHLLPQIRPAVSGMSAEAQKAAAAEASHESAIARCWLLLSSGKALHTTRHILVEG